MALLSGTFKYVLTVQVCSEVSNISKICEDFQIKETQHLLSLLCNAESYSPGWLFL